jgi:acetyl/propionyl-CoA carboxylase alpha subunit/acetyl-CoA carboxylase carboxyltransferase component
VNGAGLAPLRRIGIVNSGYGALRLLEAAKEYRLEHDVDLRVIALHSEQESDNRWVRESDETVLVPAEETQFDNVLGTAALDAVWAHPGPFAISPIVVAYCRTRGVPWIGSRVEDFTPDAVGRWPSEPPAATARHVSVQVVVHADGSVWIVGMCEGARLFEIPPMNELEVQLLESEARFALSGATGRGLYDVSFRRIEENDWVVSSVHQGLVAGHTVIETTSGVDLVKLQLELSLGSGYRRRLDGDTVSVGHAMAVHLVAEQPDGHVPLASGRVTRLRLPGGHGIRVDRFVSEGDSITPENRGAIAAITSWGRSREEAKSRLHRALAETLVVIHDGSSNRGSLLSELARPSRAGTVASDGPASPHLAVALMSAAIEGYDTDLLSVHASFFSWARRGRPQASAEAARRVEMLHGGHRFVVDVSRTGPVRYRVCLGAAQADVDVHRVGQFESRLVIGGRAYRVVTSVTGPDHEVEVEGRPYHFVRDDGRVVRTPMPGVVVSVCVRPGDRVERGDPVAVIESMKLETVVRAATSGRVCEVLVASGVQVPADTAVARLEPASRDDGADLSVELPDTAPSERRTLVERCDGNLLTLSNLVLGYDVDPSAAREAEQDQASVALTLGADPETLQREIALVRLFADLRVLFRSRHDAGESDLLVRSPQEYFFAYLRSLDPDREGLPPKFVADLRRAVAHYRVEGLEPTPALQDALYWIFQSQQRVDAQVPIVIGVLERWHEIDEKLIECCGETLKACLDQLLAATTHRFPVVADLAREVRFNAFDKPVLDRAQAVAHAAAEVQFQALAASGQASGRQGYVDALVDCPFPLAPVLLRRMRQASEAERWAALEVMTRRYYRMRDLGDLIAVVEPGGYPVLCGNYVSSDGEPVHAIVTTGPIGDLREILQTVAGVASVRAPEDAIAVDVYGWRAGPMKDAGELARECRSTLDSAGLPQSVRRVAVAIAGSEESNTMSSMQHFTFRSSPEAFVEDEFLRGLHPMMATRLKLSRLRNFELEPLPSADDVYLFHARARANPEDERLFALAEVRDLTPTLDDKHRVGALPQLERVLLDALAGIRAFQVRRPPGERLQWNRVTLYVWPPVRLKNLDILRVAQRLAPATEGLGVERIVVRCRRPDPVSGELRDRVLRLRNPTGAAFGLTDSDPPTEPIHPFDEFTRKAVQARRRGLAYPYAVVDLLAANQAGGRSEIIGGTFAEYDLEGDHLTEVSRPYSENVASIVAGVVRNYTETYPEGITRVTLLGDPTVSLGSLAEPECRRVIAAIDLAADLGIPVDWFALSSGAKIAMDSGTESMDWIAAVLRRIIEFTQGGGEINVVVTGINVGAQPYWNAESTMLMHTRGVLVMTPESAMVLTGKQALDYSGGISAEDNFGIGGYERIMGPNGQSQYWAPDLTAAIGILLNHHAHSYVAPGERFPRRVPTTDARDRDVRIYPHRLEGSGFVTVGDIFSDETNPDRKLAFDIRTVMAAVADQDLAPLERWPAMTDAETAVVWDAHLGGYPVTLLGIESRPLLRRGLVPGDGPDTWSSGTLFPLSSKKVARALNAASGNRPVVVLANLSGFDGSPDSMRSLQLEYGAEIGRAVVNFRGPIVFCVISRYHGGAFVVFSQRLNEGLETIAVEGARASVIGGAPAAAVVFAGEVTARTRRDARLVALGEKVAVAEGSERVRLRAELAELTAATRSDKLREVASEFEHVHTIERALEVGSVSRIVSAATLRPSLIEAVERGIAREFERVGACSA